MAHYRVGGEIPPKRHTQFRRPDGRLYHEELMGAEGFSSDSALLYHAEIPSAAVASRAWELAGAVHGAQPPARPRHLRLHLLGGDGADAVTGRQLVLGNADVRISYAVAAVASPLYPQCDRRRVRVRGVRHREGGDHLRRDRGRVGDYLVIPRGTTHRWVPTGAEPLRLYAIEATRTSPRPSATCPRAASSSSIRLIAKGICAHPARRCGPTAATSRCM